MKTTYFKLGVWVCIFLLPAFSARAQENWCSSAEEEAEIRAMYPEKGTITDFEKWLAPRVREYQERRLEKGNEFNGVHRIPIIFHIIHNGESVGSGYNVSTARINAQINQLNRDFRATESGDGDCSSSLGVDSEIEFCPVFINPNGNTLSNPGINRIDRNDLLFSAPPYSQSYLNSTIKPVTQWDPERYLNIWVVGFNSTLLGFASFPEMSGLTGITNPETNAARDGVVIDAKTVYGCGETEGEFRGRTLTHEIGHYLGLRHIWGDGSVTVDGNTISCGSPDAPDTCACSLDDFVTDTPNHGRANYDCPSGRTSCNSNDQITNYMDYTDDTCMRQFTQEQKDRMKTVLMNSPRRKSFSEWPCRTCTDNINLMVTDVDNPVYEQAANSITSTATVEASFFNQTKHVYYKAGNFIELQEGFEAEEGGFFEAGIGDCGDNYFDADAGSALSPPVEVQAARSAASAITFRSEIKQPSLQLYPNPASDQLTLALSSVEIVPQHARLLVFDLMGKVVMRKAWSSGDFEETIDISGLASGSYFIRLQAEGQAALQKRFLKIDR
jgi:hypothetical protein